MISDFPRANLGFWPTPVHKCPNLSKHLDGPTIYIKRDDQSGLGLGGNKVRKLEFLVGEALKQGCDTLITGGAAQSNHCRQTAAAAAMCGLECHLVLGGEAPAQPNGNLLLDELFGAHIHWTGEHRKGEDIPRIADDLTKAGKTPYIIPYGGSNALGAMGFLTAALELKQQLSQTKLTISHIIFASSSGGTHAGLSVGARTFDSPVEIYGIGIDKRPKTDVPFGVEVAGLCDELSVLVGEKTSQSVSDIKLDKRFLGGGYGVVGELERKAISLLASSEGILLDPVYSGRAFGGMVSLIESGHFTKDDRLLFWHTGGTPALFPYASKII